MSLGPNAHVRRIRAVYRRLLGEQGSFTPKPRLDPLDELIATVLSQHTSDTNTERAFAGLKERFPGWASVRDAPTEEVADAIRRGGLADQKAPRIQAILEEISEREGSPTLEGLEGLSDEEIETYLVSLPGVGPKTAACVLTFSMGRPGFPIDTHVHRISIRLGWVTAGTTAERTHAELTPLVPQDIRYELHMQLINHGRSVCRARQPHCSSCVLFDLCPSGPRLLSDEEAG